MFIVMVIIGMLFNPIREEKRILGRWNYSKDLELNKKIYLANHDHCGPCGYHNPDDTKYLNNLLKGEK